MNFLMCTAYIKFIVLFHFRFAFANEIWIKLSFHHFKVIKQKLIWRKMRREKINNLYGTLLIITYYKTFCGFSFNYINCITLNYPQHQASILFHSFLYLYSCIRSHLSCNIGWGFLLICTIVSHRFNSYGFRFFMFHCGNTSPFTKLFKYIFCLHFLFSFASHDI